MSLEIYPTSAALDNPHETVPSSDPIETDGALRTPAVGDTIVIAGERWTVTATHLLRDPDDPYNERSLPRFAAYVDEAAPAQRPDG